MSKTIRELGNGLAIKTADSDADVERVAKFDSVVFDDKVGDLCRHLFTNHPNTKISDLIFIENEKGEVVSSLCLIPWEWDYDGITIKVGEMGIVGTAEEYRQRGLIRSQVEYFKQLLNERESDISIIQGIPYFYRQFGYEYSVPLERNCIIELYQIPDYSENEKPKLAYRIAEKKDISAIQKLYNESSKSLGIHSLKDEKIWHYLAEYNPETCTSADIWLAEDMSGQIVGYFLIAKHPFGDALSVAEVSRLSYDNALDVLRHLKKLAIENNKPNIRLNIQSNCELVKTAIHHGAIDRGVYAWQINIPDMVRFLKTISPVLERRLADSPFSGLTEKIRIGFYTEKVAISFENGNITNVEKLELSDNRHEPIRIPPGSAVPLFLGCRDREELCGLWKDMGASPKYSYLFDVLFPKMESYIYTIY
jgi:predicted N-acetyltransferase YhbS